MSGKDSHVATMPLELTSRLQLIQSKANQEADNLEESPTASIMCSYQGPILVVCIKSIKVSVHVMLRITPNTDKSARSGSAPP